MEILKYKYLKTVLKYSTWVNVLSYFPLLSIFSSCIFIHLLHNISEGNIVLFNVYLPAKVNNTTLHIKILHTKHMISL